MYILRKKPVYTLRYLPDFLSKDDVFKNTALICDKQHEKLRVDLLDLKNQIFIETATWRLADWERVLNISVKPNATYDERRNQILLKFQGANAVTEKFMNNLINMFCENKTGYIVPHNSEYYFEVCVSADDKINWKELLETVNLYKPAHLAFYTVLKILLKQDIYQNMKINQYINSTHNFWNLGTAEKVYWDGIWNFNNIIDFSGIKPDALYRERQTHLLSIKNLLMPVLYININYKIENKEQINSKCKQVISYSNKTENKINNKQKIYKKYQVSNINKNNVIQNRTANTKNCWDGSFCLDGSHILSGAYEIDKQMENICVFYSTKHGIIDEGSKEIL
ncbi:putative phage tail protein [Megamonas funiformis]|jgi:hypothetical protein|uniref:Tail protein n=1 Tax=Siphoviridae sp. ctWdm1 TaxID=2827883 RepID=A0A8S5RXM6_9CAUD|nr:putative phage tail protein [Megamonas funiformis]MBM6651141.1 DUF2313 domain-containing protein [Megamonas funiformis]MCX4131321.1 DUF2313 domain-containing protein [Megamonas funiformis]DAF43534.1 MAG TPA: tail protein [Siphoviridae sp. ctWdm1]